MQKAQKKGRHNKDIAGDLHFGLRMASQLQNTAGDHREAALQFKRQAS
jgi:hypothetical protein